MMRILAIDTSFGLGSVAAADPGGTDEMPLGTAGEHARLLPGALAAVAAKRGWGLESDVLNRLGDGDVLAVIRGPGSFTGLRVGVTTAKALAWASGVRLVGVSGFEAIARRTARFLGERRPTAIAYDAGRGEVYAAVAIPSEDVLSGWIYEPAALRPAGDWIESLVAGMVVSGPAITSLQSMLEAKGGLLVAPDEARGPAAAEAADIAASCAAAGITDDPHELLPEYLRPSYAEENRRPGA